MEPTVDLEALLRDESSSVEWKRNVADASDVVRTLAAFANDVQDTGRGGHVLCGVEETRDEHGHKTAQIVGLDASRLQEIRGRVMAECLSAVHPSITPLVTVQPGPDPSRHVLIFYVGATGRLHQTHYKGEGSKYWVRIDDDTREARGTILRDLLNRKRDEVPFLDLPSRNSSLQYATKSDLSTFALEEFVRDARLPFPPEDYLSPQTPFSEGSRPLMAQREVAPGRAELSPTNLAVVLFGKEPTAWLQGAYARFSVYPGRDRASQHSYLTDIFGPAPKIIRDLLGALQPYTGTEVDKTASIIEGGRQNRERYSRVALQEAIVNAIAHRDYQDTEPVRVTVFSDRIEISSPGPVLPGIDFSHPAGHKWRNPGLAAFLRKLQLAQAEGQGIPKIIGETERVAERPPVFSAEVGRVLLTIPAYQPPSLRPPPPSPRPTPPQYGQAETQDGLIVVSIGSGSIRSSVESSCERLGLSGANILMDVALPSYIDPSAGGWETEAKRLRNEVTRCLEDPKVSRLHLFYRGPVVLAPLFGALVVNAKPLTIYYYDNEGSYRPAYTLDRRFLRSRD